MQGNDDLKQAAAILAAAILQSRAATARGPIAPMMHAHPAPAAALFFEVLDALVAARDSRPTKAVKLNLAIGELPSQEGGCA